MRTTEGLGLISVHLRQSAANKFSSGLFQDLKQSHGQSQEILPAVMAVPSENGLPVRYVNEIDRDFMIVHHHTIRKAEVELERGAEVLRPAADSHKTG